VTTKDRIILWCDRTIALFIYLLVFCLPFSKSIVEISFVICFVLWLIKKWLLYKANISKYLPTTAVNNYLFVFIVVCIISSAFSEYRLVSFRALFSKVLEYIILFFIVVETIDSKHRLQNFIFVLTASFILLGVDAVWQGVTGRDFLRGYTFYSVRNRRLRASFAGAVGFAGWLSGIAPLIAGFFFSLKRRFAKVTAFTIGILFIILLASTSSRAAMVSVVIALIVFVPLILKMLHDVPLKTKVAAGIVAALLFCGGLFYVFGYPPGRGPIDIITADDVSTRNRIQLWKQAVLMTRERPLVGWGLNTYTKISGRYEVFEKGYYYPHNSILHMGIELGLVGLMSFFAIIVRWFTNLAVRFKQRESYMAIGIGIGVLSFLLQSFFDAHLYSLNLAALFWVILAVGIAYGDIIDKEGEGDKIF